MEEKIPEHRDRRERKKQVLRQPSEWLIAHLRKARVAALRGNFESRKQKKLVAVETVEFVVAAAAVVVEKKKVWRRGRNRRQGQKKRQKLVSKMGFRMQGQKKGWRKKGFRRRGLKKGFRMQGWKKGYRREMKKVERSQTWCCCESEYRLRKERNGR